MQHFLLAIGVDFECLDAHVFGWFQRRPKGHANRVSQVIVHQVNDGSFKCRRKNPISNSVSDAASTGTQRSRKFTSLQSRKSSSRPGVATIKRAPLRMERSCCPSDKPPSTRAAGVVCLPRTA